MTAACQSPSLDPSSFPFIIQFCLIIQWIAYFLRAQRTEKKNHMGKDAHCHSYNNKQPGRNLNVHHWGNGAEICGDIHFVEHYAADKIENYAFCLGT